MSFRDYTPLSRNLERFRPRIWVLRFIGETSKATYRVNAGLGLGPGPNYSRALSLATCCHPVFVRADFLGLPGCHIICQFRAGGVHRAMGCHILCYAWDRMAQGL